MTDLQLLRAQFEQTGKLISAMEAEQKLPKINFKAIAQAKAGRLEKFGAAIKADQFKQADNVLKSNGWQPLRITNKEGEIMYGIKGKPEMKLKVANGSFSVMQHADELFAKTDLLFLEAFLKAK